MCQAHRFAHPERVPTELREGAGNDVWFTTPGAIVRHFCAHGSDGA
jgi:hypothetical protein